LTLLRDKGIIMANDTELESLFSIAKSLKSSYVLEASVDPWIKTRPSRQVGKIGEQIVAEWCKQKGFVVSKSGDSDADLVLNGHRIEIKFSTLWESDVYTFQQLRNQNYEYAFLLGISPSAAHGWFVSKSVLQQHVLGHTPQHAGKAGSDTFWTTFPATTHPNWLIPFGGTMSQVYQVMQQEIGKIKILLSQERANTAFLEPVFSGSLV
jgi:hypothetical protein